MLAVAGVVVLSYEEDTPAEQRQDPPRGQARAGDPARAGKKVIALALISALGFGTFFTLLDAAASDRPGWAIVAARAGGSLMVLAAVALARPSLRAIPAAMPALLAMAFFDVTANSLFTVASTMGLLPLVAVGGSMYPAFTIALAHLTLGERLHHLQRAGVALALAGVLLISAGSA